MGAKGLFVLSLVCCLHASGLAMAATAPGKVVERFIEGHLQGQFAEARSLTLERANLSTSLFSNWLFGVGGANLGADTADVFLSRKFAKAFRYAITDTVPSGENQAYVTVTRASPNITHLYTWALAGKRGAAPYDIIDAIDTYLTKVNFPIEESHMQFTLIREVDIWLIRAVNDEKFVQFQQQQPLQAPRSPVAMTTPTAALGPPSATQPGPTTTSGNAGRQMADAQFYATLQGFNSTHQAPAPPVQSQQQVEEKRPFFQRIFGRSSQSKALDQVSNSDARTAFQNIREAIGRYAASNNSYIPDASRIYDWQSLRGLVNQYGKKDRQLPRTEAEAGFTFVQYTIDSAGAGSGDYTLLVKLNESDNGLQRVEVTPYGIDRVN